jgi:hypothetical protein
LSQGDIERIDQQTNLETARKVCQDLVTRNDDRIDTVMQSHRRDLTTLLHDNHIGSAKIGRWKLDLNDEQGQYLTNLFSRTLLMLGYETEGSLKTTLSPLPTMPQAGTPSAGTMPSFQQRSAPLS